MTPEPHDASDGPRRIVVVGAGIAGVSAVEAARQTDPDAASTAKRPSGSRTTSAATSKPDGPIRKPPDDAFANSASMSIS